MAAMKCPKCGGKMPCPDHSESPKEEMAEKVSEKFMKMKGKKK